MAIAVWCQYVNPCQVRRCSATQLICVCILHVQTKEFGFSDDIPSKVAAVVPTKGSNDDDNVFRLSDWVPPADSRTQSPLFIAYGLAAGALI